MKNTYKIISGLFLFSVLFTSCSSEEETAELSALEKELSMDNKGTLTVESTTYIFKTSGEISKFIENDRAFDFTYSTNVNYTVTSNESKHEGDDLVITNKETGEFMRLYHFKDLKNNRLQFDVEFSNGKTFLSVVYNSQSKLVTDSNKCHDFPCRNVDDNTINSLLEVSQDAGTTTCHDAISACLTAGGKPRVTITMGNGWFTPRESCDVACN